jgi:lysophospholipase L1-like esterase
LSRQILYPAGAKMSSPARVVYLFAGDGLTEGRYGESFVARLEPVLRQAWGGTAVNAGRGPDTVQSLLKRIDGPLREHRPEWVILAVGGNDVWLPWLSRHSLGWWLWLQVRRTLRGQRPTTDLDQFTAAYRSLVDRVQQAGAGAVVCTVSPLGEQISSPPNRQLAGVNGAIKQVAAERHLPLADVWQSFVDEIAVVPKPSRYKPGEWLSVWLDRWRIRSRTPDEISRRRRLRLTFDGIHLNSRGADLWAATVLAALAEAQGGPPPFAPGS